MIVEREQEMFAAAEELRFELAARLRDEIADLRGEQLQRLRAGGRGGEGARGGGAAPPRVGAGAAQAVAAHGRIGAAAPVSDDRARDEAAFRSLAAPGLDEDDLFLAMQGPPGPRSLLGRRAAPGRPDTEGWCQESERRRRHEELLRKWEREG